MIKYIVFDQDGVCTFDNRQDALLEVAAHDGHICIADVSQDLESFRTFLTLLLLLIDMAVESAGYPPLPPPDNAASVN